MKKIILIIILFINIINIYSQDLVDPPKLFDKTNNPIFAPTVNEFQLGYNAGSPGSKLDYALNMKYYLDYIPDNISDIVSDYRLIFNLDLGALSIYGQSMHLNPCITVDSTYHFTPMLENINGSVFGFCDRNKYFL
jgi:hypothetical protein